MIEQDCAQAKIIENDTVRFRDTKNLTVALVRHTTSRKLDPHLHHHALVMNFTQKADKQWRSLASSTNNFKGITNGFAEQVYRNQIYYGVLYRSNLASRVIQLGGEIETVGPHGLWEIKGIPRGAREVMSKRRQQIEEQLKISNHQSYRVADIITLNTRDKKPKDLKLMDLQRVWQNELTKVGFSSSAFITNLAKNKDRERAMNSNQELAGRILEDAIEHLSQFEFKLDYPKIIAKGLEFGIGKVSHGELVMAKES